MISFVTIVIALLSQVWQSYVLHLLWGWFLAPVGAPVLSVVRATGLVFIVRLLTFELPKQHETGPADTDIENLLILAHNSFYWAAIPAVLLLLGWIVQQYL